MNRRQKTSQRKLSLPHLANAFAALILIVVISQSTLFQNAEFNTLDSRFRFRGPVEPQGSTVVVGIDQQSYSDLGRPFPWPREWHARLLENLHEAGARVVVFDLIFDAPGVDPEGDRALAEAMREHGRVVLGVKQEAFGGDVLGRRLTYPAEPLRQAAAGLGLVDRLEDSDGFTRRYRLTVPAGDRTLYSLGVEAVALFEHADTRAGLGESGNSLEIGSLSVPRMDATSFLINYPGGRGSIPIYSFSSVIDDADFELPAGLDVDAFEFQRDVFQGKIVVVGATLPEMQDFVRSPFFRTREGQHVLTSGAEMHAAGIETMLSERFYRRIGAGFDLLLLLVASLLVSVAAMRLRPLSGLAVVLAMILGYLALAYWLFVSRLIIVDIVAPAGVMLASHAGNTLYYFVQERRERQRIRGMFAKYVPDKVIKVLYENPDLMNLGGEERELTILFSDLAGFTPIAEELPPTELVEWLNEYLSEMTDIILQHDGIIDKYEGDLIMAEFGAPLPDADHAEKGCRAALAMQKRLAELREKWKGEGRAPLYARIGISTGKVVLGNMGSRAVHDYTVLGDPVNLASRLEGANKVFGTSIMISEATRAGAGDAIHARELDLLRVKGKQRAVTVFELAAMADAGLDAERARLHGLFAEGLESYRERRWREAGLRFAAALDIDSEDGPSRVYLERARHFLDHPPDEDWDSSFTLSGK